jgi:DNA-binding NarL/FixJ family response regulator
VWHSKEIAVALRLSRHVVRHRIENIFEALEVNYRTHAVVRAIERGLLAGGCSALASPASSQRTLKAG